MKILKLVLSAILLLSLIIIPLTVVAAEKQITLRFGHVMPKNHIDHKVGLWAKKRLAERTNGKVNLELYPSEILGNALEMGEACMAGTLDMTDPHGPYSAFWKPFGVIDFPYVFKSWEHAEKIYWGPLGKELADGFLKKTGIRILAWYPNGFRNLLSTKPIPVLELKDMKGCKIRVHSNPIAISIFKSLGASPIPMGYGEIYTSLQTGVIDAMEGTSMSMHSGKFAEVAKYLAHTQHIFLMVSAAISEKKFKSLPPDIQKIMIEEYRKSQNVYSDWAKKDYTQNFDTVRKLIKWETYPDLEPFSAAVKPTFYKIAKDIGIDDWMRRAQEQE